MSVHLFNHNLGVRDHAENTTNPAISLVENNVILILIGPLKLKSAYSPPLWLLSDYINSYESLYVKNQSFLRIFKVELTSVVHKVDFIDYHAIVQWCGK